MLDNSHFRPSCKSTIKVTEAEFTQKGEEYVPKKVQKTDRLTQMKIKNKVEKQLQVGFYDENSDDEVNQIGIQKDSGPKIVIIEGMYTLDEVKAAEIEENLSSEEFFISLEKEIESQIFEEMPAVTRATSSRAKLMRINTFPNNPKGIVKIKFDTSAQAEWCIGKMDGRWFDKRQLKCFFWDSQTDYRHFQETKEELARRTDEFGKWLEARQDVKQDEQD